jgi:hypothetical protein
MRIRAIGSVLVVAAVAAGGQLGCDKKSGGGDPPGQAAASGSAPASAGPLRVTAGEHGFSPASLDLPKGAPGSTAAVTFTRVTDKTCATEVVFPDLNLKKDLPLNTPVTVDVPTDSARTLTFQCGMAMYKGALVVR